VKLVAGLGNPGEEYVRSRHNLGFRVADGLAAALGAPFSTRKFAAEIADAKVGGERVWVVKPQTYMNASGEAVGAALRFWKLGLEDLVVVHDDLELEAFRVQVKVGGGHGGNNGVKSVTAHVGGPGYARIRMGIGRPPRPVDPADFVLGRFPRAEDDQVEACVAEAVEAARMICELGVVKAMNQFNRR
jgi:peptidyl-tRNA hydrolase, PTH1 family